MFRRRCTLRRRRASSLPRESLRAAKSICKLDSLACCLPSRAPLKTSCQTLISRKEPGQEVDCGDGHANAKEDASEDPLGAAFAEGECQARHHDRHQGKTAGNRAGEGLL